MQAVEHARLMRESETQLELAAREGTPVQMLVATRLLEHPETYRKWEAEHASLMRRVCAPPKLPGQVIAMRIVAFGLIHRKALFEYLRDRQVTGRGRRVLFNYFYGSREYSISVVSEHGNYLRTASSHLCSNHLGREILNDSAFDEPLALYEERYTEYFRLFCDSLIGEREPVTSDEGGTEALSSLRPYLKHQLSEARQAILAMPKHPTSIWREVQIRRPTGDTQKLPRPKGL
ncbi:MAG TPA: hypothetical protein VJQ47_15275 [Steroidobacteraceae bacterium]|nr:hypothetical protein [Steroidobacteraceae bacterium]